MTLAQNFSLPEAKMPGRKTILCPRFLVKQREESEAASAAFQHGGGRTAVGGIRLIVPGFALFIHSILGLCLM